MEFNKYWARVTEDIRQLNDTSAVCFSSDLNCLRIGSQIFTKRREGEFASVCSLGTEVTGISDYFEEFTGRGPYIVVASRKKQNLATRPKVRANMNNEKDADINTTTLLYNPSPSVSTITATNQEESDPSEEDSCSSEDNIDFISADDSCSEGSTDVDEATGSEEDSSILSNASSRSSSRASTAEGGRDIMTLEQLTAESDDDGHEIRLEDESPNSEIDEFDDSDSSDEETAKFRASIRRPPKASDEKDGQLLVFDISSGAPKMLFRHRRKLLLNMYNSPPVIHPSVPLVVWPLYGGEILFADFEVNSYFTRKARPTTTNSI